MLSQRSFAENIKIDARIRIGSSGDGIGILFCVPEAAERTQLNDGYCIWISATDDHDTKLTRHAVEVISAPDVKLDKERWYRIAIERIDNNVNFTIDGTLQFSYISHLPVRGTHCGIMARNSDFSVEDMYLSVGSHSILVSCLALPDAFLANREYDRALNEYRRIGSAFPARKEGREALFRAGITLIEQARHGDDDSAMDLYEEALKEFDKLQATPGAPLEWVGKSLVYRALAQYDEELKCFEMAFRRYRHHPLQNVVKEHAILRLHQASKRDRKTAYGFSLLALRHLPNAIRGAQGHRLFTSLQQHWEPLPFISSDPATQKSEQIAEIYIAIQLAFWLGRPWTIVELLEELKKMELLPVATVGNALFCLIEIGSAALAKNIIDGWDKEQMKENSDLDYLFQLLAIATKNSSDRTRAIETFFATAKEPYGTAEIRILTYLLDRALEQRSEQLVIDTSERCHTDEMPLEQRMTIDSRTIWAYLMKSEWQKAGELLHSYPLELLNKDSSELHLLYGCWLWANEGEEIALIHFRGTLEVPFPRTWTLLHHYLMDNVGTTERWLENAFLWERRHFFKQLALHYHCRGDHNKVDELLHEARQEYLDVGE